MAKKVLKGTIDFMRLQHAVMQMPSNNGGIWRLCVDVESSMALLINRDETKGWTADEVLRHCHSKTTKTITFKTIKG